MIILPNANNAVIPIEKFTKYVLNPEHPSGKHKVLVFKSVFGYSISNAEILVSNTRESVRKFPAAFVGECDFGDKYEIVMEMIPLQKVHISTKKLDKK